MGQRRRGRAAALQMLYQRDTVGASANETTRLYWGQFGTDQGDDDAADTRGTLHAVGATAQGTEAEGASEVSPESRQRERQFADALVIGVSERADEIDDTIRAVSHHWRLERMTRVDRNILRLATCELLTMKDIPKSVTLNEAIELAKRFGAEGSAKFVNGVLHQIATDLGRA